MARSINVIQGTGVNYPVYQGIMPEVIAAHAAGVRMRREEEDRKLRMEELARMEQSAGAATQAYAEALGLNKDLPPDALQVAAEPMLVKKGGVAPTPPEAPMPGGLSVGRDPGTGTWPGQSGPLSRLSIGMDQPGGEALPQASMPGPADRFTMNPPGPQGGTPNVPTVVEATSRRSIIDANKRYQSMNRPYSEAIAKATQAAQLSRDPNVGMGILKAGQEHRQGLVDAFNKSEEKAAERRQKMLEKQLEMKQVASTQLDEDAGLVLVTLKDGTMQPYSYADFGAVAKKGTAKGVKGRVVGSPTHVPADKTQSGVSEWHYLEADPELGIVPIVVPAYGGEAPDVSKGVPMARWDAQSGEQRQRSVGALQGMVKEGAYVEALTYAHQIQMPEDERQNIIGPDVNLKTVQGQIANIEKQYQHGTSIRLGSLGDVTISSGNAIETLQSIAQRGEVQTTKGPITVSMDDPIVLNAMRDYTRYLNFKLLEDALAKRMTGTAEFLTSKGERMPGTVPVPREGTKGGKGGTEAIPTVPIDQGPKPATKPRPGGPSQVPAYPEEGGPGASQPDLNMLLMEGKIQLPPHLQNLSPQQFAMVRDYWNRTGQFPPAQTAQAAPPPGQFDYLYDAFNTPRQR